MNQSDYINKLYNETITILNDFQTSLDIDNLYKLIHEFLERVKREFFEVEKQRILYLREEKRIVSRIKWMLRFKLIGKESLEDVDFILNRINQMIQESEFFVESLDKGKSNLSSQQLKKSKNLSDLLAKSRDSQQIFKELRRVKVVY